LRHINKFIRNISANGLSNVIPISSRKVERWDIWTKAKVVIGKSNGSGGGSNINTISGIISGFKSRGFKS
jgi:hypothetical protein